MAWISDDKERPVSNPGSPSSINGAEVEQAKLQLSETIQREAFSIKARRENLGSIRDVSILGRILLDVIDDEEFSCALRFL
jgi:hypothetical protein